MSGQRFKCVWFALFGHPAEPGLAEKDMGRQEVNMVSFTRSIAMVQTPDDRPVYHVIMLPCLAANNFQPFCRSPLCQPSTGSMVIHQTASTRHSALFLRFCHSFSFGLLQPLRLFQTERPQRLPSPSLSPRTVFISWYLPPTLRCLLVLIAHF